MVPREALALGIAMSLAACVVDEGRPESTRQQVIAGDPIAADDYAAVGALMNYHGFVCTGTLIAPDVVLTAAHCLNSRYSFKLWFSLDTDVADLDIEGPHKAITYHQHPGYEPRPESDSGEFESMDDIGLVILEQPIVDTPPERVLSKYDHYSVRPGDEVEVVGYGQQIWYEKTSYGIKRGGMIDVDAVVTRELMTSGGDFQPCYGDSGGPLFVDTPAGRRISSVVSRGARDGWRCDTGAIATRVEPYVSWIRQASRDHEPPPREAEGCAAGGGGAGGSVVLVLLALALALVSRPGSRRG